MLLNYAGEVKIGSCRKEQAMFSLRSNGFRRPLRLRIFKVSEPDFGGFLCTEIHLADALTKHQRPFIFADKKRLAYLLEIQAALHLIL